ncbi:MAG: hypothetical protein GY842_07915 [bacterium]|nr:hypothetical protein [bacterium]
MSEGSRARQVVFGMVIVAAAAVGAYHLVQGADAPLAGMPDTRESAQMFICGACGHVFSATPRERARLMMTHRAESASEEGEPRAHGRVPCPECGRAAAGVAADCPDCGQPFMRVEPDGRRHARCEQCVASRTAGEP